MSKIEKIKKYFISIEYCVVNEIKVLNYGASTFRLTLIWFCFEIALWNKLWCKNAISTFRFALWWSPNFDAKEGDLMFQSSFIWDWKELSMQEIYLKGQDVSKHIHS